MWHVALALDHIASRSQAHRQSAAAGRGKFAGLEAQPGRKPGAGRAKRAKAMDGRSERPANFPLPAAERARVPAVAGEPRYCATDKEVGASPSRCGRSTKLPWMKSTPIVRSISKSAWVSTCSAITRKPRIRDSPVIALTTW